MPYTVLDNKPIDQWRVTELREELRRRKLPTKGLKEELVKRLNEAIQEETELENGEKFCGDDAEQNTDSQNNTDEEYEEATKQDNSKSASDESFCAEKADASININNGIQVSGNHNDDEIEKVVLARKDEQNVSTTEELEKTPYNQKDIPQSGMQVDHAETHHNYEDSKPSIEESAVIQLEPSNQVPAVIQDLEFQVKYESNCTDSVSINEKNNITDNLIADNFPLELDVKQEVELPSTFNDPTVSEDSITVGNELETDDSHLADEQEADKRLGFDGQGIDKELLSNKQGATNSVATNDEDVRQNHTSVKKEVVLEHASLKVADMLNALGTEIVKQEVEKPSSHKNPTVGEDLCIVGNEQKACDSHLTDENVAGKKLVFDGQEIEKDLMSDKLEGMNRIVTIDEDVNQNHVFVKKELVVKHVSLEDADMLNALELEVVKLEVEQASSYNNHTVGEDSCIICTDQDAGDSHLIVDQEAGDKLVFDEQVIDKDLLSEKQVVTNSIATNDEVFGWNHGSVKKEVVVEHASLADAHMLNTSEQEIKQVIEQPSSDNSATIGKGSCIVVNKQEADDFYLTDEQETDKKLVFDGQEVDNDLFSEKQCTTHSMETNDEADVQIHVSFSKEMVVEHAPLDDADVLNASNVAPISKEDLSVGGFEKLSLDRSSCDEFIEEDILETNHLEPDIQFQETTDVSKVSKVDVKGEEWASRLETGKFSPEGKDVEHGKPTSVVEKRKSEDSKPVGNNGAPKRQRRWNPETIKVPEQQKTHLVDSTTPKNTEQPTVHRAFSRSNSILTEVSPKERTVPTSKRPATTSLRIDRFVRPFTLKAVQELLAKTGKVCDFWMDHIKTHCYVTYSSVEEAAETRNAVYNLRWPPNGDQLLVVEFVDPREVKVRVEAPPQSSAPISPIPRTPKPTAYPQTQAPQPSHQQNLRSQPPLSTPPLVLPPPSPPFLNPPFAREQLPPPPLKKAEPPVLAAPPLLFQPIAKEQVLPPPLKKAEPPVVTLDDLFKKTKATPRIYYLPLSQEQVAAKLAAQAKNPQLQ